VVETFYERLNAQSPDPEQIDELVCYAPHVLSWSDHENFLAANESCKFYA
jgi:hypothetical protein